MSSNQWYFYCPDEETANWELPTGQQTANTQSASALYILNLKLIKTLFDAICKNDEMLNSQYRAKLQMGISDSGLQSWMQEEVLPRLPFPISEPLRKLLCPEIVEEGKLIPAQANKDRLTNYIMLVDSTIDLLMSTLLSEIRDWLQSSGQALASVDVDTHQLIKDMIIQGWSEWQTDQIKSAVDTLSKFLRPDGTYFVSELTSWFDIFKQDGQFVRSLEFLYSLKERLRQPKSVPNVISVCQIGEDHLCEFVKHISFWVGYRLESIKNIRAIRFYRRDPTYRNEMVVLRTSLNYRADEKYFQEFPFAKLRDCQSILLVKNAPQSNQTGQQLQANDFLNLSPFLIDKNVFLRSDNAVFDLYSFHSNEANRLQFKHIAKPGDNLLPVLEADEELWEKQDFSVVREQYKSLREMIGG